MKELYSIICLLTVCGALGAQNIFSVQGHRTFLNDREIQVIGLRCSNSLMTDEITNDLINHLDVYKSYGIKVR